MLQSGKLLNYVDAYKRIILLLGLCDYDSGRHSVTFSAGVTRIGFNINITDDDLYEGPEVFNLAITSSSLPSNVLPGTRNRATVTIVDDEKRK